MEEDVKSRIREVLKEYSASVTQIANQFNVNQKTLNNQINDTTTLSTSTILLILEAYPDVSAEWLLRGKGKMTNVYLTDPDKASKGDRVYELWTKFMNITEEMQSLYKKEKEG